MKLTQKQQASQQYVASEASAARHSSWCTASELSSSLPALRLDFTSFHSQHVMVHVQQPMHMQ